MNKAGFPIVAFLILAGGIFAGILITPRASAAVNIETFEDDSVPLQPTSTFYTMASSTRGFTVASPALDSHSFFVQDQTAGFVVANACLGTTATPTILSFAFRFTSLPASGHVYQFGFGQIGNSNSAGITVSSTGTLGAREGGNNGAGNVGNSGNFFGTTVLAINTWYYASITVKAQGVTACSTASKLTVTLDTDNTHQTVADGITIDFLGAENAGLLTIGAIDYEVGPGTTGSIPSAYFDNIVLNTGTLLTTADHTASITSGDGFSVDPSGNTLFARTNGGATVRTYSAGTLAPIQSAGTNCVREDGVYAIATHVLYFHCDSGGVLDTFNIRSPSLTAPTQPVVCQNTGFCIADIPDDSLTGALAGDHSTDAIISGMDDFPIDYSNNEAVSNLNPVDESHVYMAFAFTTTGGNVGIVTYVFRNNAIDQSDLATYSVSGQAPDQMCVVRDTRGATSGQSFLYTASNTANAQGFKVSFELSSFLGAHNHLIPSLQNVFAGTSATTGARGIACGEGKFAILNDNKVTVWRRGESTPYITVSGAAVGNAPKSGGITMSADGGWLAWETSTGVINVLNTTTQLTTVQMSAASGTFVGMGFQGHGCTLWDMTSTTIEEWILVGKGTCTVDRTYQPPGGGSAGNTGTGSSAGNNAAANSGTVAGSSCAQHYAGKVTLGSTYVPIADWTNCASMAVETLGTIFALVLVLLFVQSRLNDKRENSPGIGGGMPLTIVSLVGYMASMYLWQAPFLILVLIGVVATAIIGFKARTAVAGN